MENNWGCDLVAPEIKAARASQCQFDNRIRADVPGFQFMACLSAGTFANEVAILDACDYDLTSCLIAQGSYVGGNERLQELSTSAYEVTSSLAFPLYSVNASPRCIRQSAVLPYWISKAAEYSLSDREEHEDKCLRHLHYVLLDAKARGKPFRAILVEYVLSGNGGELSTRFLVKLGRLLNAFDIIVIADEVLTGGRVGPGK